MSTPEVWRDVPSVAGVEASSEGRLRLKPFVGQMPHGGSRIYGGKALAGQWDGARLIWQHKGRTRKVARLICEAFHGPAPFPRAVCMHLDENSRNNRPENLRWGTQRENLNAPGFKAYCRTRIGERSPTTKARRAREAA